MPLARDGLLAFVLVSGCSLQAQPAGDPISIGRRIEIDSEVLQERRELRIATPAGYEDGSDRYPVVFLLDGGPTNFHHVSGIVTFLAFADRMPKAILVAIQNTDRNRDLTPPTQSASDIRWFSSYGGADEFLKFLSAELIPWVDREYRTRPYRILIGHSLGGLLAVHALTTKPETFNAYVAIDPSLHWNDQAMAKQAEAFLDHSKEITADLYMTTTATAGAAYAGTMKLAAVLGEKAPAGLRWRLHPMPGETHLSTLHGGIYRALDEIFDGWHLADPLNLYDLGGIPALHKHFEDGGRRYGYDRKPSPFVISMVVAGLIEQGRLEEAASVLRHDESRYPAPWNQLDALARAYGERGDHARAIEYFELSVTANPANQYARDRLKELRP